jgi:hypothetical protein
MDPHGIVARLTRPKLNSGGRLYSPVSLLRRYYETAARFPELGFVLSRSTTECRRHCQLESSMSG